MKRRITYMILLLCMCFQPVCAMTDYSRLAVKAERFYNQKEWASALAMYQLMLEQKPQTPAIYGRAIVAASAIRDSAEVIAMTEKALEYHIPFDSIFHYVRTESFALGRTNLYEEYLIGISGRYSWMKRAVDAYLTDYYVFRRDGAKMIEYAGIMLEGLPEDTGFMHILAEGYLLTGKPEQALEIWQRILEKHPDDYTALLYAGNYCLDRWKDSRQDSGMRKLASEYLLRANRIRPTPFVTETICSNRLGTD